MFSERPYAFAALTFASAVALAAGALLWTNAAPEDVLIGRAGAHDAPVGGERRAGCLDCHVPFVGTPPSRCLGPGCHGELATGTPPRHGKAMPIRFHAALRDVACRTCHVEHGGGRTATTAAAFRHDIIPTGALEQCVRCHSGARLADHPSTDSVQCSVCHESDGWTGVAIDHKRVWHHACDVCHSAPASEAHASVAGTCSACHGVERWYQ